jgi:hypothetical protein
VFIGSCAGYSEITSNRLYIENSNANCGNALIYGEFDTDILKLNACTYIKTIGDGAYTDSILTWNSSTCAVRQVPYISGLTIATNGLSTSGNAVLLGGVLNNTTTIDFSANTLKLIGGQLNTSCISSSLISGGTMRSNTLCGTGDRLVQASAYGVLSAPTEIINGKLIDNTAINLLINNSNWDVNGQYVGTAITGTYEGQYYRDNDYFFFAYSDNDWIRMLRG